MLILTVQRQGEVYLDLEDGRRLVVRVMEVDRGKVRIGFEAPATIRINRRAVAEREAAAEKGGAT